MRETTKTPGFTSPAFSLERNLVQVTLVEAPGLEPGSEKQVIQASTSVVYDLFLALQSPIDRIHPRQLVFGVP